jgi:hypothetical protein
VRTASSGASGYWVEVVPSRGKVEIVAHETQDRSAIRGNALAGASMAEGDHRFVSASRVPAIRLARS